MRISDWSSDVCSSDLVMLHGCEIGDCTLIGIGSVVLNRAKIGKNCIVGANSLVTEGKAFPDNSLIVRSPAQVVRTLSDQEVQILKIQALGDRKSTSLNSSPSFASRMPTSA